MEVAAIVLLIIYLYWREEQDNPEPLSDDERRT